MIELLPAALSFIGQEMTNSANAAIAQRQSDFQREMSDTAYQRQVADMKAAGLNPMLSYIKPGGASTPPGASYVSQSPVSSAVDAFQRTALARKAQAEIITERERPRAVSAAASLDQSKVATEATVQELNRARLPEIEANIMRTKAQAWLAQAQTDLARQSAFQSQQTVNLMENQIREINARVVNWNAQTEKVKAETANLPKEGQRLVAAAAELTARVGLNVASTETQTQQALVNRWLAAKVMIESQLLDYDLSAVMKSENFQKDFGQYGPGLKLLLDVFNTIKGRR
jgi:hypothetical protein